MPFLRWPCVYPLSQGLFRGLLEAAKATANAQTDQLLLWHCDHYHPRWLQASPLMVQA